MMLTFQDKKEIKEIVREEVRKQTSFLPTKEEFFDRTDKILGELQDIRQEMVFTRTQYERMDGRVTNLEEIHPGGKHLLAT
jgi:hypothetical protein